MADEHNITITRAAEALKAELGASEHPGLDPLRDVIVDGRCDMIAAVRAVLTAIREPSEELMAKADGLAIYPQWSDLSYNFTFEEQRIYWQAMIDAALAEEG